MPRPRQTEVQQSQRTSPSASDAAPSCIDELATRVRFLEAECARLTQALERAPARDSSAQFRAIVGQSMQSIVVHRNKPLYVNEAFVRMVGFPSRVEILRGQSVLDHIHPDDRPLVRERMARRLSGEIPAEHYEFRLCRYDGSTIWVHCMGQHITWDGEPAAIASLYDITDRKRAEQALQRSQHLFATVFQASPDVLTLTTLEDGRFVDVNDSFLRLIGRQRGELVGRTSSEIDFWGEDGFRNWLVQALRRDGAVRNVETKIRANGQMRDFAFSVEVIQFEGQELLLAVGRDLTERRREELELQQSKEAAEMANRAKSEFLANMSHELRTPLNAILGFSEVIRDQLFGPSAIARYADYARDIHASGIHLLQIINDLLDLSKLEAGKFELHEGQVAVPELVDACLRLVRGRAEAAGVELRLELPEVCPSLVADERLLKQILLNLLSNSVKFTPRGGTITVGVGLTAAEGFAFAVADTGLGMNETHIAVALAPFGQIDSSLARRHQGTGLGLPLAKSLAELHGGTLSVESQLGVGTRVTVCLPPNRVLPVRGSAAA